VFSPVEQYITPSDETFPAKLVTAPCYSLPRATRHMMAATIELDFDIATGTWLSLFRNPLHRQYFLLSSLLIFLQVVFGAKYTSVV